MYESLVRLFSPPAAGLAYRRPVVSLVCVWWAAAALAVAFSASAWAADPPNGSMVGEVIAPYATACGGKSECGVADLLEIKPIGTAKALQSVCLHVTEASCTVPDTLSVYNPDPTRPAATMIPLAPLVERWIKQSEQMLLDAPRAILPVKLILTDTGGKVFTSGLTLNLSALWGNGALRMRITSTNCDSSRNCRLGRVLTLHVPQLAAWALATKNDPAKLNLVIGNTRVPGLALTPGPGTLSVRLERQSDATDSVRAWDAVMRQMLTNDDHSIRVAVADDKGTVGFSDSAIRFEVPPYRLGWSLLGALVVVCIVSWFGHKSGWAFVRDNYVLPDDVVTRREMPYSLGRSQMLFWTIVVVTAWFLVGLSTGDWVSVNESSWILMGVGAGTVLGSISTGTPPILQKLIERYQAAASANPRDENAISAARDALRGELRSRKWLVDVSSDYGEIQGLHRIQSLLFTALIGGYFLVQAYLHGAMPELSTNVLALLGISSGAYVGFKLAGK